MCQIFWESIQFYTKEMKEDSKDGSFFYFLIGHMLSQPICCDDCKCPCCD